MESAIALLLSKGFIMAFTYAVQKFTATSPAVGTQIVGVLVADGHGYSYPTPASGSGLAYPTTVRSIFAAPQPPGAGTTDGLVTFQLNNSSAYNLPTDFTVNMNTDWCITATGTA